MEHCVIYGHADVMELASANRRHTTLHRCAHSHTGDQRQWICLVCACPCHAHWQSFKIDRPPHHVRMISMLCCIQAEAQQLVATIASAAEGYPFVPPEYLPSVLVPTVGLIIPAIAMGWVSA